MRETPATLISIGLGAFLAGTAFGYGLQQWTIKSLNDTQKAELVEQGRQEAFASMGVAEGQDDCKPNSSPFELGAGGFSKHCASGSVVVIDAIAANKSMRGTVGGIPFSKNPPSQVEFGSEGCALVYNAAVVDDDARAILSFECAKDAE